MMSVSGQDYDGMGDINVDGVGSGGIAHVELGLKKSMVMVSGLVQALGLGLGLCLDYDERGDIDVDSMIQIVGPWIGANVKCWVIVQGEMYFTFRVMVTSWKFRFQGLSLGLCVRRGIDDVDMVMVWSLSSAQISDAILVLDKMSRTLSADCSVDGVRFRISGSMDRVNVQSPDMEAEGETVFSITVGVGDGDVDDALFTMVLDDVYRDDPQSRPSVRVEVGKIEGLETDTITVRSDSNMGVRAIVGFRIRMAWFPFGVQSISDVRDVVEIDIRVMLGIDDVGGLTWEMLMLMMRGHGRRIEGDSEVSVLASSIIEDDIKENCSDKVGDMVISMLIAESVMGPWLELEPVLVVYGKWVYIKGRSDGMVKSMMMVSGVAELQSAED
ncbi:Ankyrin Repeat Domain-Containing Protein 50 [Manis pentadactyla]|nr:Ankyrin Repeat Domain-Containing Protein 50 [Manis pentadactyla]